MNLHDSIEIIFEWTWLQYAHELVIIIDLWIPMINLWVYIHGLNFEYPNATLCPGGGGGGTRVHHGRVGSAGLCDLKILHPWRRLKKGDKILQWPPQRQKRGVNILHQYEKSAKKGVKNLQF